MKAVNLIPPDARKADKKVRGGAGSGKPAGGIGAFVVVGALATAVGMAGIAALANKGVSERKADLARVTQEATVAESKASALNSYTEFATLRKARTETVNGLLDGRFDWAHGLREVARIVPDDIDLVSLVGTTSPSAQVEGAGGGGTLRSALSDPAIDLIGCARSQSEVAKLVARLRTIDGVQRVSLATSEKSDSASANETDCRKTDKMPQFQLTVFFKPKEGVGATAPEAPATAVAVTPATPTTPAGGDK